MATRMNLDLAKRKQYGNLLQKLRLEKGLTRKQLGDQLLLSEGCIQGFEKASGVGRDTFETIINWIMENDDRGVEKGEKHER